MTAPSHRSSTGEEVGLAQHRDIPFPSSSHGGDAPLICIGWGHGNPCQDCDGELDSGKVITGVEGRRRRHWWGGLGEVGVVVSVSVPSVGWTSPLSHVHVAPLKKDAFFSQVEKNPEFSKPYDT